MNYKTATLDKKLKRKMSKVIFGSGDEAGESVLKQWETMHRPPDTIPTSGPYAERSSLERAKGPGLIVPPPKYSRPSSRRHSVISSPKDNIGQFPLRPSRSKESRDSNEPRRISEVFLGGKTFIAKRQKCFSCPLLYLINAA